MKKTILMAALALMGTASASAQVEKPSKGTFGLEVQINPFDQNGKTFQLDGLKARYFLSDKDALRFKVGFDVKKTKYKIDDSKDPYTRGTIGNYNINIGYERHFDLAKRLSAYVGGEVGINRHFACAKESEDNDNWKKTKNIAGDDRANFGFSVNAITGLDFYLYKGLYIGTEVQLGVESTKDSKITTTTCIDGKEHKVESKDSNRNTSAGISIQPVLRLGWNF